jgi:hypothetical protein
MRYLAMISISVKSGTDTEAFAFTLGIPEEKLVIIK